MPASKARARAMSSASQAKINALVRLRSETLAAIVLGITNNVNRLLLLALDQLMVDNRFRGDIDGMMPYLYAAGFLALSGQDLTSKRLKDALEAVGEEVDDRKLSLFLSIGIRADLVYLYSAYYLIVMGRQVTKENLKKIVLALGHRVDDESVNRMLVMYKEGLIP